MFQPLTQLDIVAADRSKGSLKHLKEAKLLQSYQSLHTDMVKSSMTMFLSEVLSYAIQEEEANPPLFNYINAAIDWIELHEDLANFHLFFLLNLTQYLGFYPDDSDMLGDYFDLLDGTFIIAPSLNPLMSREETEVLKKLLASNIERHSSIILPKSLRRNFLAKFLMYFELHLDG